MSRDDDVKTSETRVLSEASKSIVDVSIAVDSLVVLTRAGLSRAIMLIVLCGGLLAISTLAILLLLLRVDSEAARIEELALKLSELSSEQVKTRGATEQIREKVDSAAQAADEKPTVEIRPAASASGKPQAVIVIRSRPSPKSSASAQPAIEIPIKLPEAPVDAGVRKN